MRGILILGLIFFGSSCAKADSCKKSTGIDSNPPRTVIIYLKKNLDGYHLIDKQECSNESYWLAIPKSEAINKPRSPGSGKLVVLNKKTGEVIIVDGE